MTRRTVIIVGIALVLLGTIFGYAKSLQKTVEKTVEANIYIDGKLDGKTSIKISGSQKDAFGSSESKYVGTFAIGCYEKSCREGVEAKITWIDEEMQQISFYDGGRISFFGIKDIVIDKQMNEILIVFEDGSVVATSEASFSEYSGK